MTTEEKLDQIIENQTKQSITLATMETDLRHHIKRSDSHEDQLKMQNKTITRLWFAIIGLFGAGAGNAGPSLIKWLGSIL